MSIFDCANALWVAAEEADESLGWLQALRDADLGDQQALIPLIIEANELASIFVASGKPPLVG